jgi:hypothetical protein
MPTSDRSRTRRLPVAGADRSTAPWPTATVGPRRAAGMALLVYVLLSPVLVRTTIVVCPIRRLTGRACPVCGVTRSLAALLAGDVRRSVSSHPLGWAVIPAALDLCMRSGGTSPAISAREGVVR